MICKNCGTVLEEHMAFCGVCGTAVETTEAVVDSPMTQEPPLQSNESFFAPQPQEPKKKSKAPIIIAVVAVIAVVAGVLGFVFWDDLFGKVKKEEQLAYALTHYSADDDMFTDKLLENVGDEMAMTGQMTVEVSELLTASMGVSASEITLKYDTDVILGEKMAWILDAYVGETEIASGEVYFDFKNNKLVCDLPGLIEKPVEINMAEVDPDLANVFAAVASSSNAQSATQYVQALEAAIKIAYESLLNVPFTTEKQVMTANGVNEELLCIHAKLDSKTVTALAKAFLEKVKTSPEIKAYVAYASQMASGMGGQEIGSFDDLIDDALESLNDEEAVDIATMNVNLWVDEDYDVCGAKLFNEDGEMFFGWAEAAGNIGLEAYFKTDGEEVFAVRGKGTVADDVYNMDVDVYNEGEKMAALAVSDFTCSEDAVKGKLILNIDGALKDGWNENTGGLIAPPTLIFDVDVSETAVNYSVAVNMGESMQLLKIAVMTAMSDKAEVTIPTDVTSDLSSFEAIDLSAIIARLEQAGIPVSDLIDMYGDASMLQSGTATL